MHHNILRLFVDMGLCVKQVGTPVFSHRAGPVSPDQAHVSPSRLGVTVNAGPRFDMSEQVATGSSSSVSHCELCSTLNGRFRSSHRNFVVHVATSSGRHRQLWSFLCCLWRIQPWKFAISTTITPRCYCERKAARDKLRKCTSLKHPVGVSSKTLVHTWRMLS